MQRGKNDDDDDDNNSDERHQVLLCSFCDSGAIHQCHNLLTYFLTRGTNSSAEIERLLTIRFRRTRESLAPIQRNMSTAGNRSRIISEVSVDALRPRSPSPRRRPAADVHGGTLDATAATWQRNITSITSATAYDTIIIIIIIIIIITRLVTHDKSFTK